MHSQQFSSLLWFFLYIYFYTNGGFPGVTTQYFPTILEKNVSNNTTWPHIVLRISYDPLNRGGTTTGAGGEGGGSCISYLFQMLVFLLYWPSPHPPAHWHLHLQIRGTALAPEVHNLKYAPSVVSQNGGCDRNRASRGLQIPNLSKQPPSTHLPRLNSN